ncbi:MAG: HPr(Ser) kinase/phosphatase [Clostridia bacterium]|nr:HPr(Ser) kinase/phosphatase [Clostridia bacterium]
MGGKYSVQLSKVIKAHSLETIYIPDKPESELVIQSQDVNRPGLMFAGYEKFFDNLRVEFIGLAEMSYLQELDEQTLRERLELFFSLKPPVVIITRNIDVLPAMVEMAQKYEVPLLRTSEPTSEIMATLISYLNTQLAERITRHGVMVEVYGEGILIVGDSGVGKSETAVELIKRGHRLIADDAVEIRKVSSKTLVGTAPDNIRHFIELRGIGIVNARNIFGIGAVKLTEKIDMVIQLEQWDSEKAYDRLGLEDEYISILGIKVPATTVPVKPGRNLAIIIEIAAMNNRQKRMGYNGARELMQQLGMEDVDTSPKEVEVWQ